MALPIAITIRRMELALAILLTSTLTTNGLLALWAATSRRHWFLRAAIASIGAALALAATAVEVAIALAGQPGVVAAGLAYVARAQRQHRDECATTWRFSLATFLLATVLVTVGAAVVANFPAGNRLVFQSISLVSVCGGLIVLVGAWGAGRFTRRDAVGVIGAMALGGLLLSIPLAWFDWFVLSFIDPTLGWPPEDNPNLGFVRLMFDVDGERPVNAWLATGPATALAVMFLSKLCVSSGAMNLPAQRAGAATTPLRRWSAATLFAPLAAAMAIPAAFAWQRMTFPDPIPTASIPEPNGMDNIVAAGRLLEADVTNDPNLMFHELIDTRPKLERVVRDSAPALLLLRGSFKQPTLVPPNYTEGDLTEKVDVMMRTRDLGRALDATGDLAVQEMRYGDAADAYLDSVSLGMAVRNGGLLIDVLPAMAIAREGIDGLRQIRRQLSTAERRAAIETLADLYAAMEWHGEFERRDRIWSQHSQGWHGRLDLALTEVTGEQLYFNSQQFGANSLHERAQIALLIIELAILNHVEDHGTLPECLDAIELPRNEEILIDPYRSNHRFLFTLRGPEYRLYSVGVDGVDDGGAPPMFGEDGQFDLETRGDLTLDTSFVEQVP
jgi:hypothetical protein